MTLCFSWWVFFFLGFFWIFLFFFFSLCFFFNLCKHDGDEERLARLPETRLWFWAVNVTHTHGNRQLGMSVSYLLPAHHCLWGLK